MEAPPWQDLLEICPLEVLGKASLSGWCQGSEITVKSPRKKRRERICVCAPCQQHSTQKPSAEVLPGAAGCHASLGARQRSSRLALRSRTQVLGTLCLENLRASPKKLTSGNPVAKTCSPNAEGPGQIPGQETKSHMPPLRPTQLNK